MTENKIKIYSLKIPKLLFGTANRSFGNMRSIKNRQTILKHLNIQQKDFFRLKQIHSDKIIEIYNKKDLAKIKSSSPKHADGWISTLSNIPFAIFTSDCVPLFLWDNKANIIGLAHCGWRGVAEKLPYKIAKKMLESKNCKKPLNAFIGPHIHKCCFEVKEDCYNFFDKKYYIKKDGKIFVDLYSDIKDQLIRAGIDLENIKNINKCTCCDKNEFFSFRRDKKIESLISFIYKKD